MKIRFHSVFSMLQSFFAALTALALCLAALPARAQDTNVTISAADFQQMVYSANLYTQLALKPELGACLQTLLEMQRRNPDADPMALADVSRQALQFYRTNEPFYIRTNGYPDEILAAYLDALRHIPAHTNFVPANLTMLNYFMLDAADYNYFTNDTVLDLINSANQRLSSSEGEALKRQALVDNCVARAQGNAAFAAAMDNLLLPETGVSLQDTPAEIIDNTNSPLHDDETMTNLLALSQASGNGSLTVSSNQLINLFSAEMQTVQDTINTNLAVLAQINESQPDYLAYLTNQAAVDANVQLITAVQQDQPARLASASAAVLVQSKLLPVNEKSAQIEGAISSGVGLGVGIAELCAGDPSGIESVTSGGLDLFNLFTGNQSPQDVMANKISNIQTMMGDLSTNINYRFDRVDQSLTTIFNTMNQQFSQIEITLNAQNQQLAQLNGNVYAIRNSLVTVQSSLDRIEAENIANFSALQYQNLIYGVNGDLLYEVQFPSRPPITETTYESAENTFYTYATYDAQDSISSPSGFSDFSSPAIVNQLTNGSTNTLDDSLNYIWEYLNGHLGAGVSTAGTEPLANPQEWFIAAYAYLQLAVENPMWYRDSVTQRRVSDIISRGQNIADFGSSLTFIPGTTNLNWNLWNALETNYTASLINFNSQVSNTEAAYGNLNGFNVGTWRQWEAAASPTAAAAATGVRGAPENPYIPGGGTNVVAIAGGDYFGLELQADGTVVGWGQNNDGDITIPANLNNMVAIAAGGFHCLALKADGTVVGWGDNSDGDTVPAGLSNVVAIAAGLHHSLALKTDGTVVGWGDNSYGQINTASLNNVVAIAAGQNFSLALKADGTVVGRGNNNNSEISIPGNLNNVVAIAAGYFHSLALKADGTVVGWGDSAEGQTYTPSGLNNVVAIAANGDQSLALKADGTVVGWGEYFSSRNNVTIPAGLNNVVAIGAGPNNSYFLQATNIGGPTASGDLSFIREKLPERLGSLFQDCNQNTIDELGRTGSDLDTAAVQLTGAKALLSAVLQLGMPYTLAHDGVLHGFLYGSESLMSPSAATTFLQNQDAQLQASPNLAPQALTVESALRYEDFQSRLNQDLTNLQAMGQPEIPRLVGQTLRLLNLLHDAWTPPTNSPPPALEISSQSNAPSLLLYGEPYMNYTLQYRDNLGASGWTTTTLTNLQDGQAFAPPFSSSSQGFYRLMLPTP